MGLQVYRKKRKFDVTPEPRGRAARTKGNQFVIQKHAARRLHYDLRLELDGVMKSWAVTRGPSLVPGEKRLAIHVEDHPIEYNAFEGTIPKGEYGGGTVMIWDRGRWYPEGDPHAGFKKGRLDFRLEGEKLHGRWHLVRMRGRAGEKKQPWLLIKSKDEAARSPKNPDILEDEPLSVVSGRSIDEIAEGQGRKRVWHSNKSVKDNVKAGATGGNGSARHKVARLRARTRKRARAAPAVRRRPRRAARKARARTRSPGRTARRCRISCRPRSPRCAKPRPAATAGCMRSNSTATASRHGSTTAKFACSRARGSIGSDKFPNIAVAVGRAACAHGADRRRDRGRG